MAAEDWSCAVVSLALKPLAYEEVGDAPDLHRVALRHFLHGLTVRQVAIALKISKERAEQIQHHPCNVEWLEAQRAIVAADEMELLRRYQNGVVEPTLRLNEHLLEQAMLKGKDEEGKEYWAPGVSEATMRKLLDVGYKHDPKGTFAPKTKHEETRTISVMGTVQVLELRQQKLARHLVAAEVSDGASAVVSEAEFACIRQTSPVLEAPPHLEGDSPDDSLGS